MILQLNRLTIKRTFRKNGRTFAKTICKCGTVKTVRLDHITSGKTRSCGCLHKKVAARTMRRTAQTHKLSHTREYSIYCSMMGRCHGYKKGHPIRKNYGDKGIRVCKRWRKSFRKFLKDMGKCPPNMTIDRKDNTKGYNPKNCQWSTRREQARNKSNTRWISYNGKRLCLTDWAEALGVRPDTLSYRIAEWGLKQALTQN